MTTIPQILFALSGTRRWAIVNALADNGPMKNSEICKEIGAQRHQVSADLLILRDAGIIEMYGAQYYRMVRLELFALFDAHLKTYKEALDAHCSRSR